MFELSERSFGRLKGVDKQLVLTVEDAIQQTKIDFGVICGMRTLEEQQKLFNSGASQTLKSKHLEGKAVDLMAYVDGRASWEINVYDDIAEAMRLAARTSGARIRWGAAWHIHDLAAYEGTMEEAMNEYIDLRRSEGKRPFIDGPHFELMES
mgnify:CR=1 FL=1|tara:strand:+ start:377 stop:832 length:456 start_codon:yes stop_codon:yes gene_type:complete